MIRWAEPNLGVEEKRLLKEVIDSGWIGGNGPKMKELERTFANVVGANHAIAVCNGTCGLLASVITAKEFCDAKAIAVPTFTFIAPVNVAAMFKPLRLLDCRLDTFEINLLEKNELVIPVDVGGLPCDLDWIIENSDFVIEDACEALGSTYKKRKIGSIANISVFSLHAAKVVTSGEGGMITTNDEEIAEYLRSVVNQGYPKEKAPHEYSHIIRGLNFRMTEMQAAIALAQLRKLRRFLGIRKKIAETYKDILGDKVGYQKIPKDREHPYFLFLIVLEPKLREKVLLNLKKNNVETKVTWKPVHLQPPYSNVKAFCPNSERIWKQVLSLPIHNKLTEEEAQFVAEKILEVI